MEDGCLFWFEYMFHLQDAIIVSMQHSYTFSSRNVPYSVGEDKSICKIAIHHEEWPSGW